MTTDYVLVPTDEKEFRDWLLAMLKRFENSSMPNISMTISLQNINGRLDEFFNSIPLSVDTRSVFLGIESK